MRPLDGVRVLDLSQLWAAPGCAMYLADQGADVVKVEPLTGDEARYTLTSPPIRDGQSRSYLIVGRNKRGMAIDLRTAGGQAIVHRLIPQFDVVVVNFRLGAAERLKLDYETLRQLNRRLIYVHVTAYGWHGPYAQRPGYDLIVQSLNGLLSRRRMPDGTPIPSPVWAADCSAPMFLAYAVALALLMRERTGEGQQIRTSLLGAALAMQSVDAVRVVVPESEAEDTTDYLRQATYAPYRCGDGAWLIIIVIPNRQWERLCLALGIDYLSADPRFDTPLKRARESATLHELLAGIFETRARDEWLSILEEHEVPVAPVLERDQIFDHQQFRANGLFVDVDDPWAGPTTMMAAPFELGGAEPPVYRPAPQVGQHTREILREAGFPEEEIDDLLRQKVILAPTSESGPQEDPLIRPSR
ncbi:MAG: CoA transferase [Chloroflexi bacterium]|nr:CoA transferase [Chloroflexota bacterium]